MNVLENVSAEKLFWVKLFHKVGTISVLDGRKPPLVPFIWSCTV